MSPFSNTNCTMVRLTEADLDRAQAEREDHDAMADRMRGAREPMFATCPIASKLLGWMFFVSLLAALGFGKWT